jgi:protocatechuate 3,4-dioxygenase beta subunit
MRARSGSFALLSLFFASIASAAVTGYVVNSDGQPIAGARVALFAPETVEARRARLISATPQRVPLATAESGTNGKFTIETPKDAPPVVDLRAEAAAFAPSFVRIEKDEDAGAIPLTTAAVRHGTVTAGAKPVANATVIWSSGSDESLVTTNAEGRYDVADPAKWANHLTIIHPDFAVVDESFGGLDGGHPQLDRTMSPGVPLSGRVVGEDGTTPVAKADIAAGELRLATTGDDGTFTIAHAPAKWDTLTARAAGLIGTRARTATGPLTIRLGRSASVTGSVRVAKTQAALAGAEVRLLRSAFMARGEVIASAFTDAKGNYALPSLPAGAFNAYLFRPGFAGSPASFSVTPGQKLVKNLPATEESRVAGSVLDEEKRPIAGAMLTATDVETDRGAMFMMARPVGARHEAMSAPDGRFVIRTQADADLQILAAKKGLPSAKTATLRLAPGERKSNVILTIPRGVALTGRVVDGDGKPVSGVAVEAAQSTGSNFGMNFMRRMGGDPARDRDNVIRTGSDGTFSLRVREGSYDVTFTREGFAPKQARGQQVTAASKPLEVTLEPGAEITGRVTRSGAGVEGVNVTAISEGSFNGVVTASDGSFRLSDLTPGSTMVNFRKPDAFIQVMRNVTAPSRDVSVELPAGGRITGRVFDKASHNPVTSFQAGINVSRSGGGRAIMMPPQLRSFTSDDGSFVLENVPPGDTQVVVNAPGYTAGRVAGLNVEDGKTIAGVEVGLETGTRLTGRITNSEGQPISGATVRQDDGSPIRMPDGMASTDANGEYAIESLQPGEKTFQISANGYLPDSRSITLSGRDARLDVQLSPGMKVAGVVVTDAGTPLGDARVSVRGISGGMGGRSTRTDANGTFQLEGLAPGHYSFVAEHSPYAQGVVRDFDISSGAPLRIVMTSGATIYGHVSGLSAAELSHAQVTAWATGDDAGAEVDASGNFRIEGAPSGSVRIQAETRSGMGGAQRNSPMKTIDVAPGAMAQVDLEFSNDTTVRGRVTRNGRPLGNAMVDFLPNGRSGTHVRAQADATGSYSATGLGDGPYRVAVVDLERFTPYSTSYEVTGSGTFDIDIKAAPVRGRVTDSATGEGVADAKVELRAASNVTDFLGLRSAITDANGGFLIDSVAPGAYHISGTKTGYGSDIRDVTVTEAGTDSVNLALSTNDGIALKVVDGRDGRPLSAVVRAYDAQGRVAYDSLDRFFGGGGSTASQQLTLAAGQYRVVIQMQGYATRIVTLSSPSQQTIALTPGGTLVLRSSSSARRTIRLLDTSGQPYERSLFGNAPTALEPSPAAVTITNVTPGVYTVQVMDEKGQVTGSSKVTVLEGQTVEVAL